MSDFHKSLRNPEFFLGMEDIWEVVHNDIYSIEKMSEEELRQAIVQDVLGVTMWEKHFGQKLHFGRTQLLRFVEQKHFWLILNAMQHEEIVHLLDVRNTAEEHEVRIRDDRTILQAAMDYCGIWYTGFEMPPDAIVRADDADERVIEEYGSLENLAMSMAMDLQTVGTASIKTQH